jgi:hypothetical protein
MVTLTEILFSEKSISAKDKSERYAKKVRTDVLPLLVHQAKFILDLMDKKKRPTNKDVLNQMDYYMSKYKGVNPIESTDSYGVSLVLGYLLKDEEKAAAAKRYYRSLIDAWMKSRA